MSFIYTSAFTPQHSDLGILTSVLRRSVLRHQHLAFTIVSWQLDGGAAVSRCMHRPETTRHTSTWARPSFSARFGITAGIRVGKGL